MKVTPLNVLRFWKQLMFPPNHPDWYLNRMSLKMDLPWEPWLHCCVWLAVIYSVVHGEWSLYPPEDAADWIWLLSGLTSPPIGFASVWMLAYKTGKVRYIGIWQRMVSDIGLATCLLTYLCSHIENGRLGVYGVMGDAVVFFSAWFTLALVSRDIQFIIATEKLAHLIYEDRICKDRQADAG